jgi:hypothetical protein
MLFAVLSPVCFLTLLVVCLSINPYLDEYPRGCDTESALKCEYEFLVCKLFGGPANDAATLCKCAGDFFGKCLRNAGVMQFFLHMYVFTV